MRPARGIGRIGDTSSDSSKLFGYKLGNVLIRRSERLQKRHEIVDDRP